MKITWGYLQANPTKGCEKLRNKIVFAVLDSLELTYRIYVQFFLLVNSPKVLPKEVMAS